MDWLADSLPFCLNGQSGWIVTFGSSVYGTFFDESERLIEGDPLCVAGYTFKSVAYKQFCRGWKRLLATGVPGRRLTALHMYELIGHKRQFDGIELPTRVKCFERAVDLICEHAMIVTGALVDQKEFEEKAGADWPECWGGSYTTLCQRAAQTTAMWLQHKKRLKPILYTFESGHKWQYQTDQIFRGIGHTPHLRKRYQYEHHTFADKATCYGAQAADFAAWISVRIRVGDAASAKSIAAFMPGMLRLVQRFQMKEDAMVRFLKGDVLQSFIDEQRNRPVSDDVPCDVGTAKRTFR